MESVSKTRMRLLVTVEEEVKQGQVQCLSGELCTVAKSLVSGKVIGQCGTSHGGATSKVLCKVLALSCQSRNLPRCPHPFPPRVVLGGKPPGVGRLFQRPSLPWRQLLVKHRLLPPPSWWSGPSKIHLCLPVSVLASYACSKLTTNPAA